MITYERLLTCLVAVGVGGAVKSSILTDFCHISKFRWVGQSKIPNKAVDYCTIPGQISNGNTR